MHRAPALIIIITALVAGLAIGALTRPKNQTPASTGAPTLIGKNSAPAPSRHPTAKSPAPSGPAAIETGALDDLDAWLIRIDDASTDDFPALVKELNQSPADTRLYLRRIIFARWVEEDLESALAFTQPRHNLYLFKDLMAEWSRADLDAAFDYVASARSTKNQNPDHFKAALTAMSAEAARTLPLADLLKCVNKEDERTISESAVYQAFSRYAKDNPATAAKAAEQLPRWARRRAIAAIARVYAGQDPEQALAWAQALDPNDPAPCEAAVATAEQAIAARDLDAAVAELASLSPGENATDTPARPLFVNLLERDPQRAAEWFKSNPGAAGHIGFSNHQLFEQFGKHPEAALEFAAALGDDFWSDTYYIAIPPGIAHDQTFRSQLESQSSTLPPHLAGLLRGSIATALARDDLNAATRYAETLTDPILRDATCELIANFHPDPLAVWEWARTLGDEDLRKTVQSQLVREAIEADFETAHELFNQLPDGNDRTRLADHIIECINQFPPSQGVEWAAQLEPGRIKHNAYRRIAHAWAESDPAGASTWLANLTPGPERDHATSALSMTIAEADPPAAFAWAASIEDESLLDEALITVFSTWQKLDPTTAASALQDPNLSPSAKAVIENARANPDPFGPVIK